MRGLAHRFEAEAGAADARFTRFSVELARVRASFPFLDEPPAAALDQVKRYLARM
jgi:hypothetical protein